MSIPIIRVAGTHREAGAAIGTATRDSIRRSVEGADFDHDIVLRYRGASVKHLPWVVDELDAAARAAEVDPLAIYEDAVALPTEGFLHPALFTDDLDAELAGHEVVFGPEVVEGPFGRRRIAFVTAPGGIRLEFMEQLEA